MGPKACEIEKSFSKLVVWIKKLMELCFETSKNEKIQSGNKSRPYADLSKMPYFLFAISWHLLLYYNYINDLILLRRPSNLSNIFLRGHLVHMTTLRDLNLKSDESYGILEIYIYIYIYSWQFESNMANVVLIITTI